MRRGSSPSEVPGSARVRVLERGANLSWTDDAVRAQRDAMLINDEPKISKGLSRGWGDKLVDAVAGPTATADVDKTGSAQSILYNPHCNSKGFASWHEQEHRSPLYRLCCFGRRVVPRTTLPGAWAATRAAADPPYHRAPEARGLRLAGLRRVRRVGLLGTRRVGSQVAAAASAAARHLLLLVVRSAGRAGTRAVVAVRLAAAQVVPAARAAAPAGALLVEGRPPIRVAAPPLRLAGPAVARSAEPPSAWQEGQR